MRGFWENKELAGYEIYSCGNETSPTRRDGSIGSY